MEYPKSWNALTASLAACDLRKPSLAWAFAVVQGLVRDDPGDRDMFLRSLEMELERGEITGPSVALRVASALSSAGIVRPPGMLPDPWGEVASARLEAIASWAAPEKEQLESLRRMQDWQRARVVADQQSEDSEPPHPSNRTDGRKRWWKLR